MLLTEGKLETTVENTLASSCKLEHVYTLGTRNSTPKYIPRETPAHMDETLSNSKKEEMSTGKPVDNKLQINCDILHMETKRPSTHQLGSCVLKGDEVEG